MSAEPVGDGSSRLRLRASLAFSGEQHFYGLGQGGGAFDRLGVTRQLWNTHIGHGPGSDMGLPLLVSSRGYALFFDNPGDAGIAVGRSDNGVRIVYTAETGNLAWYFLLGGDLRGVMRRGGRAARAPPAAAALGARLSAVDPALSRHGGAPAVASHPPREADPLRRDDLPLELWRSPRLEPGGGASRVPARAVVRSGSPPRGGARAALRGHHPRVPRAPRGIAALRRGGVAWLSPGRGLRARERDGGQLSPGAALRRLLQPGRARVVVVSSSRTRRSSAWRGGGSMAARDRRQRPTLHGGSGRLLHNIYDRFRHEAFAEGEAADRPDQRVFLLCRSGAAGMQRFGATCWSGDINNDFATLEAQIPLGLNTGLSGVPYWGTDVGGFFHPIPESGELYARWFQLGAFSPIFRSHGWVWREHVPWAHGSEVEAICRQYAELRYRLLPYTYTLAWQAHVLGLPLMRPLVLNYPDDPRVWGLGHQFLWGDDLLVAPVTREGATDVARLPAGGRLVRLLDGRAPRGPRRHHGGGAAGAAAALRPGRRHRADGARGPAHGGAAARRRHLADLSRWRLALRALRGRRANQRLPPRAVRADPARMRDRPRSGDGADRRALRETGPWCRPAAAICWSCAWIRPKRSPSPDTASCRGSPAGTRAARAGGWTPVDSPASASPTSPLRPGR